MTVTNGIMASQIHGRRDPRRQISMARPDPPGKFETCVMEHAPGDMLNISRVIHWLCRLRKHWISTHSGQQLFAMVKGITPRIPSEQTNSNPHTEKIGASMISTAVRIARSLGPTTGANRDEGATARNRGGGLQLSRNTIRRILRACPTCTNPPGSWPEV